MTPRHAIFVAPFEGLSEPGLVAQLAARTEERGGDGFFVWDHVAYREPVRSVADPWITLAVAAAPTGDDGPLVRLIPRRRQNSCSRDVHAGRPAREARAGVGLGASNRRVDPDARLRRATPRKLTPLETDSSVQIIWDGEFERVLCSDRGSRLGGS